MRKLISLVAAIVATSFSQLMLANSCDDVNVMSFNIRTDTSKDAENGWQYRRDRVGNAVNFYTPDLVGMQEVRHNQLVDLVERLPEYQYVGVGRNDGKEKGEYCPVWFKKDRFTLIDSGNFWLSETPKVAGSKGWDTAYERVATWVKLLDNNTGKTLVFMNTHLDHKGVKARREGAKLLLNQIDKIAGDLPVILTGDFNAVEDDEPIMVILDSAPNLAMKDSHRLAKTVYGPNWTFHNFGRTPYDKRVIIDYIFVKGDVAVNRWGVLAETENTEFLSDHAPIMSGITIR